MFTKFLLPPPAAKLGWFLTVPGLVLIYLVLHHDFSIAFLTYENGDSSGSFFGENLLWDLKRNNFTDELGTLLLLGGLMLLTFARQPDEDERIRQIRLESLLWAVLVNMILIMLSVVLFYNGLFLQVMAYNMATTLLLFIVRFYGILFLERRKSNSHD